MNVTKYFLSIFSLLLLSTAFAKVETGEKINSKVFNESTYLIGDIKKSLLTESEHLQVAGSCWALMRGQNVSDSDYGALIRKQNNNPAMTVMLPNNTNLFERDTGAGTGLVQEQDWKGFYMHNTVQNRDWNYYNHNNVYMGKSTTGYVGNIFVGNWDSPAAALGMMWDASEVRPRNLGVNQFIKINNNCAL